ncbi:hypothetical protein INR49_005233 [Caranx melampygus]|nr:hypothetical protein INR49_005233 [Caranx melampygus]
MAQGCLKCLKYTMCVANFLCFMCGAAVLGLGVYLSVNFKMAALAPSLASLNFANILLICGIIITCVSFLGFMGALKENRCLLLTFFLLLFILMLVELSAACILLMKEDELGTWLKDDLNKGLAKAKEPAGNSSTHLLSEWDFLQKQLKCCGINNSTDWGVNVPESCSDLGSSERPPVYWKEVLGMCFAMTLFCHISRSGLGYKL